MMDKDLIQKEWEATEQFIKNTGRPKRLIEIDKDKTAMIVIDMQTRFVAPGAALEIASAKTLVPNTNILTRACRSVGIPIVWIVSKRRYYLEAGLITTFEPSSPIGTERPAVFNEAAWESDAVKVWPELEVDHEKDYEIVKYRYSALIPGSSNLERVLRTLGKDTLIMAGVATNVCLGTTVMDAMMLDFKVIVVSDATGAFTDFLQQAFLMNLKMVFADVVTTAELVDEIKRLP